MGRKNGEIRVNLSDTNYAESLFPYQFSSVQITRSKKHQALSTLTVGHLRKSRDAISDSGGKTLLC